jgi:hypothetical protein
MELPKTSTPKSINKFRGTTPSEEYTQFFKNAAEDIEKLYTIINENNDKLKNLESISTVENRFLFDRVNYLEDLLAMKDIELMSGNSKYTYINARNISPDPLSPISVSQEYNQVTLGQLNFKSKLYLHDEVLNKNILPPNINVEVNNKIEPEASFAITNGNNPLYAIDGSTKTCWQERVEIPNNYQVDYIESEIIIPIMDDIITNRDINTVSISPHPVEGIDIINIEILSGDSYIQMPGFQDHSQYNSELGYIKNAKPCRFYFNNIQSTGFKITLRQSTYINEEDKKVFYLGAYSIDIGYTKTITDVSGFVANLQLLSNNNMITNISSIIDNKTLVGDLISYEIYYINELDELVLLSDSYISGIVVPSDKLVIIGKIQNTKNEVIPALSSIKIEYNIIT